MIFATLEPCAMRNPDNTKICSEKPAFFGSSCLLCTLGWRVWLVSWLARSPQVPISCFNILGISADVMSCSSCVISPHVFSYLAMSPTSSCHVVATTPPVLCLGSCMPGPVLSGHISLHVMTGSCNCMLWSSRVTFSWCKLHASHVC